LVSSAATLQTTRSQSSSKTGAPFSPISGVFLQGLENAADDIVLLVSRLGFSEIGYADPLYGDAVLHSSPEGIVWKQAERQTVLTEGAVPQPGIAVVSTTRQASLLPGEAG